MHVEITHSYTSQYPDPICFDAGVEIHVEREDPDGSGWFWCRATTGKEGWVHRSFLAATTGATTSLRPYTAHELTVAAGEHGTLLHLLDGWVFLRLRSGEEGWIPQRHTSLKPSGPTGGEGIAPTA